jgi:flagellar protein FlbD
VIRDRGSVIRVTRLNGKEFFLNAEHLLSVEETPDTVVTLLNRDKVVVKEKPDEVVRRVIEYQRSVRGIGRE